MNSMLSIDRASNTILPMPCLASLQIKVKDPQEYDVFVFNVDRYDETLEDPALFMDSVITPFTQTSDTSYVLLTTYVATLSDTLI